MILIIGGLGAGKRRFAAAHYHYNEEEMSPNPADACPVLYDLQDWACSRPESPEELAALLGDKELIICNEIGCGLIPLSREERAAREKTGRLCQLLAVRAETVIRLYCGIPQLLKGALP